MTNSKVDFRPVYLAVCELSTPVYPLSPRYAEFKFSVIEQEAIDAGSNDLWTLSVGNRGNCFSDIPITISKAVR